MWSFQVMSLEIKTPKSFSALTTSKLMPLSEYLRDGLLRFLEIRKSTHLVG